MDDRPSTIEGINDYIERMNNFYDNWISKPLGAFLLPVLILFVSLVVMVSVKFEKDENKRHRIEATIGSVIAIVSTLLLAVHLLI